jgi:hypothetical protein
MRHKFQSRAAGRAVGPSRPNAIASSDDVFRDHIFSREKAAHLLVRGAMPVDGSQGDCIERAQARRGSQVGLLDPVPVGDAVRGRTDLFSTDALLNILAVVPGPT